MDNIHRLAEKIIQSNKITFLTGAGISTDSGIPDFRSPTSGLWNIYKAEEILYIDNFYRKTKEFYSFALKIFDIIFNSEPNSGHKFIADLEKYEKEIFISTQNIDGLHHKAGSSNIAEIHGSFLTSHCTECSMEFRTKNIFNMVKKGINPPLCTVCKGKIKPDVVFFGENLPVDPLETSITKAVASDLFIVVGSSLQVNPAALIPGYAKSSGAAMAIINKMPTPYDSMADIVINEDISSTVAKLNEVIYG